MDKTTIVTTFSRKNWKAYASRTIPTWLAYLDHDFDFHVYADWQPISDPRITYFPDSAQKTSFIERNRLHNRVFPRAGAKGYITRWETYCHKVFAQCESAALTGSRFLMFLDADVAILNPLPDGYVASQLNQKFCGYLGRTQPCTETGLILYDLHQDPDRRFFLAFLDYYLSDRLFDFDDGWDDCHVFDRCRQSTDLPFENLSGPYVDSLDPIAMGPLGEFFDHWISKASKKEGTSMFRQFRPVPADRL